MGPLCTIIIPSRDCLDYLPLALQSISMQRRDDLEVIVIDDGSTDGTHDWLERLNPVGFELRVLSANGIGPAAARNVGIAEARGGLIAFLDADDLWWPGKLDNQIAFHLANPSVGLSFTDYIHVSEEGQTLGTCFDYWKCRWIDRSSFDYQVLPDAEANLLETNVVGTSCAVASRAVLEKAGGFDGSFKSAGDWDLWLRMAANAGVAYSSAVTMTYLMRQGSVSTVRGRRIAATADIVSRYAGRSEPVFKRASAVARARLNVIEAEAARLENRPWAAALHRVKAVPNALTGRLCRELVSDAKACAAAATASISSALDAARGRGHA